MGVAHPIFLPWSWWRPAEAPEPCVAEPEDHGWRCGVALVTHGGCFWFVCPGYRFGNGAVGWQCVALATHDGVCLRCAPGTFYGKGAGGSLLLGCVTGLPECGLGWGCILVHGSDFGVQEVDFFC